MDEVLLTELKSLERRDAETREKLLSENRLYGTYDDEMQQVHRENATELASIVAMHGWPGISKVGLAGCQVAWLIAQHSICTPALQREFLLALEKAANSGDAPMKQVALLTDRIRFNEGKPQVYGTVLDWNVAGELGCDLEDPKNVDSRRLAVGLQPFKQALKEHRREVSVEGGKPPDDFKAYKKAVKQWAQQVGWR